MLKQSTAVAILLLTLPANALARDSATQNFLNGSSNTLRGVDTRHEADERATFRTLGRPVSGTSVGGAQANPVLPANPWGSFEKEKDCDGRSVKEFMSGKCNKLYGIDSTHSRDLLLRGSMPPAWGGDEFVRTEGFTQSGAPYQSVPLPLGIPDSKIPHLQISPNDSIEQVKRKLQNNVIERLKNQ